MYQYLPIEGESYVSNTGCCRVFGLRVLQSGGEEDIELMVLPNVSTSFAFTLRLASLFTRKQLDLIHLLDVLEDLL